MKRHLSRAIETGEQGAMAVFVAIVAVALIGVAAFAVDIGWGYSDRRQMQNAADAAAMAGTRQLVEARWTTDNTASPPAWNFDNTAAQNLDDVVISVLKANQAKDSDFQCEVLDDARGKIADCIETAQWMAPDIEPIGVRVSARSTRSSVLGGIFGEDAIDATAKAAAEVRPLSGGGGPFMVCAYNQKSNGDKGTDLPNLLSETVVPGTPNPSPPLWTGGPSGNWAYIPASPATDWTINRDAVYPTTENGMQIPEYLVHDPKNSNCDINNESWKGLADPNQEIVLPDQLGTNTGTKAGPTRVQVANQCGDPDVVGCLIQIPICVGAVNASPASESTLWCVKVGTFELTEVKSNSHRARLIPDSLVGGVVKTGEGTPKLNEPKTIVLWD